MLRIVTATSIALVVSVLAGPTSNAKVPAECPPQILFLPELAGHEMSWITAMNESGWTVGWSGDAETDVDGISYTQAVLWRDGLTIDLEIGGGLLPDGRASSTAVDVSEDGLIATQRTRYDGDGFLRAMSSWLWRGGTKTRLLGEGWRHRAIVEAVNDHGIAVGTVMRPGARIRSSRPVIWRDGTPTRLPLARGVAGQALAINNNGLVVGWTLPRSLPHWKLRMWYWRLDGGEGPLRMPSEEARLVDVDDRERILGSAFIEGRGPRAILWRGTTSQPSILAGRQRATSSDLSNHGDLTGASGGFRGQGDRVWVSHLNKDRVVWLPDPPNPDGWANTGGTAVTRGINNVAPQGGVTVGGFSQAWDFGPHATIWTCTQTY